MTRLLVHDSDIGTLLLKAVAASCLLLLSAGSAVAAAIDMGELFPEVSLEQPASAAERDYLGVPPGETFTLSQVEAEVVLVEVLNVLCPHCRKQTRPYNQLYEMIEADPQTRGRVKIFGVAVANSAAQISDFVEIYAVAFPIISDPAFALHRAIRGGPTPLSIYVRQAGRGQQGMVAGHHLGEDHDMAALFAYLKELLTMQAADFEGLAEPVSESSDPQPPLSPQELARLAESAFKAQGDVSNFEALNLEGQGPVFTARVDNEDLFAAVISRSAICDVCHDVHYLILFDRAGKLMGFESIMLTGYGNVDWSAEQVQKMRARLLGRRLGDPWRFNPDVDAISRATMSAAIVFDGLRQGRELLEAIERAGLR